MSAEFFDVIKEGRLEDVQRLLSSNPDLIHAKDNGVGPVLTAVYYQEPAIAEFLAEKAGDLTIFEAAATGKTELVKAHISRDPQLINAYAEDGFQPLGLACFFGHYETAEFIIKFGADVNSHSKNPLSAAPIQSAAAAGHVKIVMLLLNNGADPNVREQGGYTPLHAAAQNGDTQMIRALLLKGAHIHAKANDGKLPIDFATEGGHKDAAALLKEGITRQFSKKSRVAGN
jgi:ankyrin repeat protein